MAKTTLDYALEYHDAGLCVIPLNPKTKAPSVPWRNYENSRPTRKKVSEWFAEEHNIGIVCGAVSGNLVVVDFDDRAIYEHYKDNLPATWLVETSRGVHVYIRTPEPVAKYKLDHIDVQGEGSYVVAPPSIHPDGTQYSFAKHRAASIADKIAVESLQLPARIGNVQQVTEREPNWVTAAMEGPVKEGTRDDTCTKLAGHFLRLLPKDEVEQILLAWGQVTCNPPFPPEDVLKCVNSISEARGTTTTGISWLTFDAISTMEIPDIPELINQWARPNDLSLLVGSGGTGKSTIALSASMALATGVNFLDFQVDEPAKVAYLDLEMGEYEFYKVRVRTLAQYYDTDLLKQNFFAASMANFRINQEGRLALFRRSIEDLKPRLIIIDNHARFHTGDPNSERDMYDMVLIPFSEMMKDFNCGILYLVHTTWKEQNRPRGSIALFDTASRIIAVSKGGSSPRNRVLSWTKNRPAASLKDSVENITITYEPETFSVVRSGVLGDTGDDVLARVTWPITKTNLAKLLVEELHIGRTAAFERIRSMIRSGDVVDAPDGRLERPGTLPTLGDQL